MKFILMVLVLLSALLQASDLSYSEEESAFEALFNKKETQLVKDIYVNINLFTALTLVDNRLMQEYFSHKENQEQPILTLSYRF